MKETAVLKILQKYKEILRNERLDGAAEELYKWEALKKYKGRPNLDAENLSEELGSIDFHNLIYHMATRVMKDLAEAKTEAYRECLSALSDEDTDLGLRVKKFKKTVDTLYKELVPDEKKQSHHDERTIAALLTYRNPDKYSFYKYKFYDKFCEKLGIPKAGKDEKYVHYMELTDVLINEYIKKDEELLELFQAYLPKDVYQDPNYRVLAQDILYSVLEKDLVSKPRFWRLGSSEDEKSRWSDMLNHEVISIGWSNLGDLSEQALNERDLIKKRLQSTGHYQKNNRLASQKAGEIHAFYRKIKEGDIVLVQRGENILGVAIVEGAYQYDSNFNFPHQKGVRWLSTKIPFKNKDTLRRTVNKITNEEVINQVKELIDQIEEQEIDVMEKQTSLMLSLPLNHILYGPPGTGKTYRLQTKYVPLFKSQFSEFDEQVSKGQLIANLKWWEVAALVLLDKDKATLSEIMDHEFTKYKISSTTSKKPQDTLRTQMAYHAIRESKTLKEYEKRHEPTFFDKEEINGDGHWFIEEKRKEVIQDLIKTYEELKSTDHRSEPEHNYRFTTFHQAFSYEDFIEGIKPVLQGADEEEQTDLQYRIEKGLFYQCCEAAAKLAGFLNLNDCIDNYDKEQRKERFEHAPRYALFIDEINRGNVAAILGELITLIEDGKRLGQEEEQIVQLPYSKTAFGVPANLHIIGTMNTADRSVEALDTALRRRFTFEEVGPSLEVLVQKDKEQPLTVGGSAIRREELLRCINQRIEVLLDRDHCIGHSYFLKVENEADLKKAFAQNILPLLQEYFYGDYGKIALVVGEGFCRPLPMKDSDSLFAAVASYDAQAYAQNQQYELPLQEADFNLEQALLHLLKRSVGNKEEV